MEPLQRPAVTPAAVKPAATEIAVEWQQKRKGERHVDEARLRMYCLKTTWLCKVNRQRQSWFKNKDVPKAELLANLLVGLAALKDKGIELQK